MVLFFRYYVEMIKEKCTLTNNSADNNGTITSNSCSTKGDDTIVTNDAVADFLESNLQNFIRDCNAKVVLKCEDSQDRDPGKSLGCFMS